MSWLLKKVVHNEAMKEDPKEIYGWRVFMLACSVSTAIPICWGAILMLQKACFGGMLFGMDSGIIGGVLTMPGFKK
jgi:hypothetical protein